MTKAFRVPLIVLVVAVVVLAGAGVLSAAEETWDTFPVTPEFRGPGGYLNCFKILACWLVFLAWVKSTDWVSIDCQELKQLNYQRWNPIVFGSFMAAFVLVWLLPSFWMSFPLLVIAYVVPLVNYIVRRNAEVTNEEKVLTREHLGAWFSEQAKRFGAKGKGKGTKAGGRKGAMSASLLAEGGPDDRTNNARLLLTRQTPGLRGAQEIVMEGLAGRATAIMLDYAQQSVVVRHMIDGVWIPREPRSREFADQTMESLKTLCGLNPKERRNRQEGQFAAEFEAVRYSGTLAAQGTAAGERVVLQFRSKKPPFKTLDELGLRTKQQEQLKELMNGPKGFLLFSAIPEGGLRTTMDVALHCCDRFTREFIAVEDEGNRYTDVENVPVTTYNAASGDSLVDMLVSVFRKEPNVAVVRDLVNAQTVSLLCKESADDRLIFSSTRATDCAEALLRVLSLGVPPAEFAKTITAVINQRLVRKLCDACKEAYVPPPETLAQLGIPSGRVKSFYRPPQQTAETIKDPCKVCGAIGYLGRTAIFEVLVVGDSVRKVLATNPRIELLRQAARKDGMTSLQEEGALLVVKGTTSLAELMRVLKQ